MIHWLVIQACCPNINAFRLAVQVVQVIDVKRTSWFDMITQYSAIFGSENVHGKVDPPLCRWATTTVANFIQILMKYVPLAHRSIWFTLTT